MAVDPSIDIANHITETYAELQKLASEAGLELLARVLAIANFRSEIARGRVRWPGKRKLCASKPYFTPEAASAWAEEMGDTRTQEDWIRRGLKGADGDSSRVGGLPSVRATLAAGFGAKAKPVTGETSYGSEVMEAR